MNLEGEEVYIIAIIDKYSKEELEQIVQQSNSFSEVALKLGYATHTGQSTEIVKNRISKYGINTDHFQRKKHCRRTEEDVFCENSTASQHALRDWFKKRDDVKYECSICGLQPEWQGKPLTLILDHINGHNKDNRLENLRWVCPNCNQQLDTTGYKKMRVQANQRMQKKYYCKECGQEISKNSKSGLCSKCAAQKTRVCERPNRETLKQLIRTTPFTTIAAQYKVTDNAVRKWCDQYQLPRTKTVIRTYSDADWDRL